MEKVVFCVPETEEKVEFFVLEQTVINGYTYLLVTEQEDGDSDAYIMKDISSAENDEAEYVMVEDDMELDAISQVFREMLDDVDFER